MYEITASADIAAPPEAVWALLCDPARYPDFVDPTDEMLSVPEAPFGEGSTYREYGGIPPFKAESEWTVTAFEPVTRQVHVGDDGGTTMHLDVTLEPTATGTRYTQVFRIEPRWFLRPVMAVMWPLLMRGRGQTAMDRTADGLRRLTEAERPAPDEAGS